MRQLALVISLSVGAGLCLPSAAWAACAAPIARIVSIDNSVQIKDASAAAYAPATLSAPICLGDSIRVGEFSRATIAFLDSGLRLTIEQNTEFAVRPPRQAGRSFIDLVRGAILFFTRQPRSLDVSTPFVNAAVEGTEFLIRVDGNRAEVAVLEGTVVLTGHEVTLQLTSGQSGEALAGQPPRRIDVRPEDAVRWALYYEPVLPRASLQELEKVPSAARDARYFAQRASALLGAGRVNEARADLAQALKLDPKSSDAYALSAIVDVAQNRRDEALENARRAVSQAPESVPAGLALSYALQSNFELEAARDALLRVLPRDAGSDRPEHAPALARLAELWLSLGYVGKAIDAANRAAALAKNLARPHIVLGFAELARIRTAAAKASFDQAIALESSNPLAHLGLGLAKIRAGDLHGGRQDIETAAALDVEDAIVRSYLGKAYFEEKRDGLAAGQFESAKRLDPRDPTPFFYDAIRKQTVNRPVEALQDLEHAIARNDDRAVYRSRFLLDQDLAARSASLGRLYRDLGFEQLAPVQGWKSLDADPGDYSGHRLLADTYSALPRHETARVSEFLQAQLFQPLSVTPVPPSLAETNLFILERSGPTEPAFNEFNPLFNRNRLAVLGSGTFGSENVAGDEVTVSGVWNRLSFSVGQFHYGADGFRENNRQQRNLYNAFTQVQLSSATSVQAEVRAEDVVTGDLVVNFDPGDFAPVQTNSAEGTAVRFGVRHAFGPTSQLIASVYSRGRDEEFHESVTDGGFVTNTDAVTHTRSWTAEARHVFRSGRFAFTSGLGHFRAEREKDTTVNIPDPDPELSFTFSRQTLDRPQQTNVYAYSSIDVLRRMTFTLGASGDFYRRRLLERNQFNPKVGFTWSPTAKATVRAAAFRTLNRAFVSAQTIEPTQVAGFNQLFADREGDEARRYGVALDYEFSSRAFGGVEYARRDLRLPVEFANEFFNVLERLDGTERFWRSYLYWAPASQLSVTAEYFFERLERDAAATGEEAFLETRTHRMPLGIRFFSRSGLSASLKAWAVDQSGVFFNRGLVAEGESRFWVLDAAIEYRLPRRYGRVLFETKNLLDNQFNFQDTDPGYPMIRTGRVAVVRLILGV